MNQRLELAAHIGIPCAAEVHHPLIIIAYQQIHAPAFHIYPQCAQCLHSVHKQQNASFPAQTPQLLHIDPVPSFTLHQIYGNSTGVFVTQCNQLLRRHRAVFRHGITDFQSLCLSFLPSIAVANPPASHSHHIVLRTIIHRLGDHCEQLGRALSKGDTIRRTVDHLSQRRLRALHHLQRFNRGVGKLPHRVAAYVIPGIHIAAHTIIYKVRYQTGASRLEICPPLCYWHMAMKILNSFAKIDHASPSVFRSGQL